MPRVIVHAVTAILLLVHCSVSVWAQNPSRPAPQLLPFAENEWILLQDHVYEIGGAGDRIVVPAGFVTDFASIPPLLQSLYQINTPSKLPALIHDYLYWEQGCSREQADRIFKVALREHRVDEVQTEVLYRGVRLGGEAAWQENIRDRLEGLPRVIPIEQRNSITQGTRWPKFRDELRRKGYRAGPRSRIAPQVCAHGDG